MAVCNEGVGLCVPRFPSLATGSLQVRPTKTSNGWVPWLGWVPSISKLPDHTSPDSLTLIIPPYTPHPDHTSPDTPTLITPPDTPHSDHTSRYPPSLITTPSDTASLITPPDLLTLITSHTHTHTYLSHNTPTKDSPHLDCITPPDTPHSDYTTPQIPPSLITPPYSQSDHTPQISSL